jgi:hypothetical protein
MPQPEKSPLADKITKIGDQIVQFLVALQTSSTKVLKQLGALVTAAAIAAVVGSQIIKGAQEKTAPIIEKNGVETVEVKPKSTVYKVKGR